jgi:hypothetical protein
MMKIQWQLSSARRRKQRESQMAKRGNMTEESQKRRSGGEKMRREGGKMRGIRREGRGRQRRHRGPREEVTRRSGRGSRIGRAKESRDGKRGWHLARVMVEVTENARDTMRRKNMFEIGHDFAMKTTCEQTDNDQDHMTKRVNDTARRLGSNGTSVGPLDQCSIERKSNGRDHAAIEVLPSGHE